MSVFMLTCYKNIYRSSLPYTVSDLYKKFHSQQLMLKYIKFNPTQQAKLAAKFLAKNESLFKKRARNNINKNNKINFTSIFDESCESYHPKVKRRNKILLEKITEIISSTDRFSEIVSKGFEVTQIKVQPSALSIHVLWYTSYDEHIEELSSIVNSLSQPIYQELCNQRVFGRIPPIKFVRDDVIKTVVEVEKRLKLADFGPDYESLHSVPEAEVTESLVIQKQIDKEIWDVLDGSIEDNARAGNGGENARAGNVDDNSRAGNVEENARSAPLKTEDEQFVSDPLTIKKDVFGVNTEKIKNLVKKSCKDSKALHRLSDENQPSVLLDSSGLPAKFQSVPMYAHSRTTEIVKWVNKYKKTRKGKAKMERLNDQKELIYLELEQEKRQALESEELLEELDDFVEFDTDHEDYSNAQDLDEYER